ncbi:MAG: hypothetical protein KF745_04565 [Phycisphaeraceae bacterium]|nr:hypothetical protein [Phycisphaeraceae bacterium]
MERPHPLRLLLIAVALATPASTLAQPCQSGTWVPTFPNPGPAPRAKHALTFDSWRGNTILFGGTDSTYLGDTWAWNGSTWTLLHPGAPVAGAPSPRMWAAMTFDSARGRAVLFGGSSQASTYLADLWEFDGATWSPQLPTGPAPSARYGHAIAYDSARARTVLFGGFDGARRGDTWEWNGSSWSERAPDGAGPSARYMHAMAFDPARARTVLFGGFDGALKGDTWEWNGSFWSLKLASGGPTARSGPAMWNDAARTRIALMGGHDGAYRSDTWEWNGAAWSLRAPTAQPTSRTLSAGAFDSWRSRSCLFGGLAAGAIYAGDTWQTAETTPTIADHPDNLSVPMGQSAAFAVVAAGSGPMSYQWRRNGQPLTDSLRIAGAGSPTLVISPARLDDTLAMFDVIVSNACGSTLSAAARLTVTCRADVDGNRVVEPADLSAFIATWSVSVASGTLAGDFDRNGVVEPPDVGSFIWAWIAAVNGSCPP